MASKRTATRRPRKQQSEPGKRFPLNMRTTREVREQLEAAAKASGRSLAQETEHRIARSFERQGLLHEVLELSFGSVLGGLLLMAGAAMRDAGSEGAFQETGRLESMARWPDSATGFDQAKIAADVIFEAARPEGAPRSVGVFGTSLGVGKANALLAAAKGDQAGALVLGDSPVLAQAAIEARAMLGTERTSRLKIDGPLMTLSHGTSLAIR
jgi:hypothetical protein